MRHSQSQQTRYRFAGASSFQIQVDLPPAQYQVEHPQKDDKPTCHETFSESAEGTSPVHAGTRSGEQEGGDAAEGGGGAEGSREEGGFKAEEQGEGPPEGADEQLRGRGGQREHVQRQRHQEQN